MIVIVGALVIAGLLALIVYQHMQPARTGGFDETCAMRAREWKRAALFSVMTILVIILAIYQHEILR